MRFPNAGDENHLLLRPPPSLRRRGIAAGVLALLFLPLGILLALAGSAVSTASAVIVLLIGMRAGRAALSRLRARVLFDSTGIHSFDGISITDLPWPSSRMAFVVSTNEGTGAAPAATAMVWPAGDGRPVRLHGMRCEGSTDEQARDECERLLDRVWGWALDRRFAPGRAPGADGPGGATTPLGGPGRASAAPRRSTADGPIVHRVWPHGVMRAMLVGWRGLTCFLFGAFLVIYPRFPDDVGASGDHRLGILEGHDLLTMGFGLLIAGYGAFLLRQTLTVVRGRTIIDENGIRIQRAIGLVHLPRPVRRSDLVVIARVAGGRMTASGYLVHDATAYALPGVERRARAGSPELDLERDLDEIWAVCGRPAVPVEEPPDPRIVAALMADPVFESNSRWTAVRLAYVHAAGGVDR